MNELQPARPMHILPRASWLGEIPTDWRVLRGKFVFSEYQERSVSGDETLLSVSEYYGVKPRAEAIDDGEFLSRAESLIGYKKCEVNDLAVNIMLAWKKGLGVSRYAGIVSPSYSVFRFKCNAAPEYMHYLLRTDLYADHFKSRSTGIMDSRLRLYPEVFGDVDLLLPPLSEQTGIGCFLDHETAKIDRLINKQQQLIALLKEKQQAVISHAVTKGLNPDAPMKDCGVEWLGKVPAHWDIVRLKHAAIIQSGIPKGKSPTRSAIEVPMLRVANVQDGWLNLDDVHSISIERNEVHRFLLREGDVLMNEGGDRDKLGRGTVWRNEIPYCIHQNHVFAIRPSRIEPEWLDTVTRADYAKFHFFQVAKQSTNLASISSSNIGETPIVIPPADERRTIIRHIRAMLKKTGSLLKAAELQFQLLQERRTALISAAVTGKVDVRGWKLPKASTEAQETA